MSSSTAGVVVRFRGHVKGGVISIVRPYEYDGVVWCEVVGYVEGVVVIRQVASRVGQEVSWPLSTRITCVIDLYRGGGGGGQNDHTH